jgi:phosphatidylserine decarboxylase
MALRIHREGFSTIPVSLLIISLLVAGGYWIHPILGGLLLIGGCVLAGLILYFFRDPDIVRVQDPSAILAPCEGKVVVIEQVQDTLYFQEPVRQISIYMSPLNVHVNRNPISGEVIWHRYLPGKFLLAANPKSSTENERSFTVVAGSGIRVGYLQIAGYVARRIRCYIREGDQVAQGAEFGFIKFGSRMDVLLPLSCEICVSLGQPTEAGRTVLARIPAQG